MYICPVCNLPLTEVVLQTSDRQDHSNKKLPLRCEQGHSFDRHKKGYINLLLSQNKRSKQPGDDAAMIAGRREFLQAGYYQIFADKIAHIISTINVKNILDAGCGEGFYLNTIVNSQPKIFAFGFDISKPAIQAAASQYKHIEWAVASSARLPYADNAFDMVMSVFSRIESEEFARVLKPGGYVLFAGPGEQHLLALRQLIYPEVREYSAEKHDHYFNRAYELTKKVKLTVPIEIDSNRQIMNLLSMTPHGQRVNRAAAERLKRTTQLMDLADFRIYLYQKVE